MTAELPPAFSEAETARRRAALDAVLAEHEAGHALLYGANRAGSAVQWLKSICMQGASQLKSP